MIAALTIIIVNYRTPQLTVDCLRSIYDQTETIRFEVIIVDNQSGDNSRDIICGAFPQVKWLQMSYNSGFARANNEGIRQSAGEIVLLLNSDTLNKEKAIVHCFEAFRSSLYVACGVQLLNADGTPQISGNYIMTGGLNHLLPLPYVGNIMKWIGNITGVKKTNISSADTTLEVDWINGAFLMVKKDAIRKAGLMDEDFFLYAEEAEWCSRLKKIGRLCIYGQFKVVHLQGATANESFRSSGKGYYNLYDRKGLQIMLSNFVRIRKQFGIAWYFFHLIAFTITVPVFFLFGIVENMFSLRNPIGHFPTATGFASNVGLLWRYLPTVIANKPHFYKVM